jgi:DNA-binding response OmpR family regulator
VSVIASLYPLSRSFETIPALATRPRERIAANLVTFPCAQHVTPGSDAKEAPMPATVKKILLVDDDDDLREALGEQLVMTEDFDVFEAANGHEAMDKVRAGLFDLVILDVGLPDTDGRELCRLMRKQGVKCPVLMLTGHDSDADTILGLDAGANDYITKPFKFPVLLARIRAQLRQHEQSEDAIFQLGPYTFKPAQKMLVTEDEKKIRLTEKETNILKFLYRASEGVVARDVLLHEVWGYNAGVTTHTLETHIYRLRQKIEPDPSNARLLVTESGGYRLVA